MDCSDGKYSVVKNDPTNKTTRTESNLAPASTRGHHSDCLLDADGEIHGANIELLVNVGRMIRFEGEVVM